MTAWLALFIPLTFVLAALFVPSQGPLRQASVASGFAALLAAVVLAALASAPEAAVGTGVASLVRLDVVSAVMLGLVCVIAVVITRFSRSYLRRDPGARRYARALLATLGAVTTLVLADDLRLIATAWMATSFALHQLLTFFRERTQALVAAHKKFLLSRLADACMLTALSLIGLTVGSLGLDDIHAWALAHPELPPSMQAATVLVVLAVCLKSAQLPFHGWLTQVMEAPTPVSALLHAGVVNIGGFLMIRLAPLMAQAPVAQTLLVVVGTVTTVVAALVMTTRVSIKVMLAWSTCAQMGFMLVQCGLGAWNLALLHLVAHSLYKAHAFLGSGGTVVAWRVQSLAPRSEPVALPRVLAIAFAAVAAVAGLGLLVESALGGATSSTVWPLALLLGLSLAPMLARAAARGAWPLAVVVGGSVGVALLYAGLHALSARVLVPPAVPRVESASYFVVGAGLVLLFTLQVAMQARPNGALARTLGPRLFAGFYLDEIFTRLTFRLWPPKLPPKAPAAPLRSPKTVET